MKYRVVKQGLQYVLSQESPPENFLQGLLREAL